MKESSLFPVEPAQNGPQAAQAFVCLVRPGLCPRPKRQNVSNKPDNSELNQRKVGLDLHPTVQFTRHFSQIHPLLL